MSAFFARTDEKARLGRFMNSDELTVSLVYGRRRIGKSELIKVCLRESDRTGIYYECKQTTELNNVQSLAALVADALGYPPLAFGGIEELLGFIFDRARDKDLILVLDEYPYLRKSVVGLDSILQALIDSGRSASHLSLVLCGSYVDVMKSLLEQDNPLFGRVDLALALGPLDYYDSANFYPQASDEDKVRLYSVFGGVPYYNSRIDSERSVRQNIIELIAGPNARLENEVEMYLRSEISKMENANEVFEALASGYSRYKDILSQSHVSSGPAMVDVLNKLVRMELVERQAPMNDPANRRKTSYRIVDGLSLFYYRYLFRYASQRSVMNPEAFYDRYISEDFETNFVPHAFEDVCRQFLVRENRAGTLRDPFELIGRYRYDDPVAKTSGEFDVVTQDERGYAFYEAKFRSSPVSRGMIVDEIGQVEATGLACHTFGFFSRSGYTDGARELAEEDGRIRLYELEDLYREGV